MLKNIIFILFKAPSFMKIITYVSYNSFTYLKFDFFGHCSMATASLS